MTIQTYHPRVQPKALPAPAITGISGLIPANQIKEKLIDFLDVIIGQLVDVDEEALSNNVKSSLEHLVDFFIEGKSIGSLRGSVQRELR
ncbi:MAG: hypothetical protein LBI81_03260 [Puniceicoccales bacterium]|jgi:hypothetical protein|nr:hypothetical protein [Puniceicoccales bacterium]